MTSDGGFAGCRIGVVALLVVATVLGHATLARGAGLDGRSTIVEGGLQEPAGAAPPSATETGEDRESARETVPAAVADPTSVARAATAAREAEPSAENWLAEAEARERLGDLEGAIAALRGCRDALPSDDALARGRVEERLAQLEEDARGAVADEGASEHRAKLDAARERRVAAARPKLAATPPAPPAPRDQPIVRKWYFWVTLAAIVASAGAVAGLAIDAGADKRREDEALRGAPSPSPLSGGGATLLRF